MTDNTTIAGRASRVPAIDRAARMLSTIVSAGRPVNVSELARQLAIPKSSAFNLCNSMEAAGWVRRTDEGYTVGARFVEYGQAYVGSLSPAREFEEVCEKLGTDVSFTSQLAVLSRETEVVYIARRQGTKGVTVAAALGQPMPAHCTGAGKALLATLSDAELKRRVPPTSTLPALTKRSITDPRSLFQELDEVRTSGYAVDDEETFEGVYCIARSLPRLGHLEQQTAVSVTLLKAHALSWGVGNVRSQLDALHDALSSRLVPMDIPAAR